MKCPIFYRKFPVGISSESEVDFKALAEEQLQHVIESYPAIRSKVIPPSGHN